MTFGSTHHTVLPVPFQVGKRSKGGYWSSIIVGGRRWRVYFEPRCKVCMSGLTEQVHVLAASNHSPRAIMDALAEDHPEPGFTQRNLNDHLNRHLPGYKTFGRALKAAASALKIGTDPAFVSAEMYAHVVLNTAFAGIVNGTVAVKPSDAIAAARFLHDMQRDESQSEDAEFNRQLTSILIGEMRKRLSADQFRDFLWSVRSHPGMDGYASRFGAADGGSSGDGYIDADVIDDDRPPSVPPPELASESSGQPMPETSSLPVSEIVKFL